MAFTEQHRRALGGSAIVVVCLAIVALQGCWHKETPTNTAPSPPIGIAPPPSFGPPEPPSFGSPASPTATPALTDADPKITKLENRRETLIPLLEKAEDEKAELVAKLRDAGVAKSSDLKNNPTAQRYAVALQKVSHDIKTIQDEIGRLDEAITHAKALSRRAEQDKVRITDEELAALTVDSGNDSPLTASDPANLDALLAKELAGSEVGQASPRTRSLRSSKLVGTWELLKLGYGGEKIHFEFTASGSVISRRAGLEFIGSYAVRDSLLTITDTERRTATYALEFSPDAKTVLFREDKGSYSDFKGLDGRWTKTK